ncbi:MAG: GNAT family N-acetyltransferase [Caldithrix sp.]|nr:GNAT family N-acetyltransferase [Caldithrix sp.]
MPTKLEFPVIQTDRLILRRFTENDTKNVFKGLSHPEVVKYYGIRFDRPEAVEEQMQWFADLERTGSGIWWAICCADHQTFYGAGGLNDISRVHKKAEIGFWLLKDFWGRGIMREALPLICQYGFRTLGLHRIEAFVETGNLNSKKTLQTIGFDHEGTMVDCETKNGRFISLDIFAKLNKQ